MPNWNEVDLLKVDLATLAPEQRGELHAEVQRRARIERAQVLRGIVARVRAWLRGSPHHSSKRRPARSVPAYDTPRGPLDLIFGGRI